MKKLLVLMALAFGLVLGPNLAHAVNTPTPNATLTQGQVNLQATQTAIAATATYIQTAYPSWTPTQTPTGTLTPSPTFTPGPKQLKSNDRERIYIPATQFLLSAGTGLVTLSQDGNNLSAFSFPDSGATMRFQYTVPWNFRGALHIYGLMACQSITETDCHLTVNANGQHFNMTTATAGAFSYYSPGGGQWTATGVSTNVIGSSYGSGASLWPIVTGTNYPVFSRVLLPIPAAINGYIYNQPNALMLPGDTVNFSVARSAAGSTTVYLYGIEIEGDYSPQIPR